MYQQHTLSGKMSCSNGRNRIVIGYRTFRSWGRQPGFCVLLSVILLAAAGCALDYRTSPTRPKVYQESPKYYPLTPPGRTYIPMKTPGNNLPSRSADGRLPRITGLTIVVDPGHGGKDTGAPGRGGMPEKQIVLMIANQLADELRACGARIIQTRRGDSYVSLDARAAISNRYRANLFISIHADAAPNLSATGTTLYIEKNPSSTTLRTANSINRALREAGFECRGVRREDFQVLKNNTRPAVLVECGYLTNANEAAKLNSSWYRNKIARTIARGIAEYFGQNR